MNIRIASQDPGWTWCPGCGGHSRLGIQCNVGKTCFIRPWLQRNHRDSGVNGLPTGHINLSLLNSIGCFETEAVALSHSGLTNRHEVGFVWCRGVPRQFCLLSVVIGQRESSCSCFSQSLTHHQSPRHDTTMPNCPCLPGRTESIYYYCLTALLYAHSDPTKLLARQEHGSCGQTLEAWNAASDG